MRAVVVGHRAGNTAEGVRAAVGVADVAEADVHLFRGRLEVRHGKTLGPLARQWERWHLLDRDAPRPSLHEIVAAAEGRIPLMLDLKGPDPRLGRRALDAARPLLPSPGVFVSARVWRTADRLRGAPGVTTLLSVGSRRGLGALLRRRAGSVEGVAIHRALLTPHVAAELRARAGLLWTWPVDDPDDARRICAWGVNGLISDAPGRLGMRSGDGWSGER
ncbi:glycerophosphodiester phosphodiesterase [Miltoncostaea oceani]|uniref:glycerophosphodiester phosphodiesterase n=1 Tax=Miltoncostaea oceani TaxID=2843216 RepID=UPI001C3D3E4E|nr:glycerophosphodiester phosphodiesterase [Miltoncostaea oceani]